MGCLGVTAGAVATSRDRAASGSASGAGNELGWPDVVGALFAGAGASVLVSEFSIALSGSIPSRSCGPAVSVSEGLATAADTAATWTGESRSESGFVIVAGSPSDTAPAVWTALGEDGACGSSAAWPSPPASEDLASSSGSATICPVAVCGASAVSVFVGSSGAGGAAFSISADKGSARGSSVWDCGVTSGGSDGAGASVAGSGSESPDVSCSTALSGTAGIASDGDSCLSPLVTVEVGACSSASDATRWGTSDVLLPVSTVVLSGWDSVAKSLGCGVGREFWIICWRGSAFRLR